MEEETFYIRMYIKFESIILSRCAEKCIKFYFAVRVKKISKNILLAVSLKKKKWGSRTPFNQNLNLHNKYMRYIRITRVLNREENYVLNRDVCYYCTGTANISIRLRAVESERRAYSSDCEIQYSGIFFLFNRRRGILMESRYPWILCRLVLSVGLIERPARLRFNFIVLFRCGNWKKGRRRWIYTVRFARALLSTRNPWRAPMESHGYAKKVDTWNHTCSTTNCRGIILSLISTKSTLKMIFIYFFLPKKNSMQIVSQDRSSLHSSILTKYFVKIMISSQKYARNSIHKFIKFLDNRTNPIQEREASLPLTLSSFSSTFIARYRKRLRAVVRVVSYSLRKSSR